MWMFLPVSGTITAMESTDRKRLARAVIARRVELGMKTTKALAEKAGLSARMLGDVENGRRDNFSDGAKAQIEQALGWDAGSIDAILSGGKATVSFVLHGSDGRPIQTSRSVDGYEQEDLELYRLASIVMDARDLVRSQTGPLMTALSAVLDEATELVTRIVARNDDGDVANARWFIEETRTANHIRRQGDVYVVDPAAGSGRFIDTATHVLGGAEFDTHQPSTLRAAEQQLLEESLTEQYVEMFLRAIEQQGRVELVNQAREQLKDLTPYAEIDPEIDNDLYVQYMAARHTTPHQGGDPKWHAGTSLSQDQRQAAQRRYRRELSEMILFDGHIRTAGLAADHIAEAIHRVAPAGYRIGQSDQGHAGGEENQDTN